MCILHIPTGLDACASDERSQLYNKRRALQRLAALLEERRQNTIQENASDRRHTHYELERGNPVRVFRIRGKNIMEEKSKEKI